MRILFIDMFKYINLMKYAVSRTRYTHKRVIHRNNTINSLVFLSESQLKGETSNFIKQFYLRTDSSEIFTVDVKLKFKPILRIRMFRFWA